MTLIIDCLDAGPLGLATHDKATGPAATLGVPLSQVMVATTNPGHLAQFVPAELWNGITLEGQ